MGQLGFFDADKRLIALSAKGDPLEAIDRLVPWETFRADIEAVVLTPEEMRKSSAGRKPLDAIVLFRMLVLQALNNLSDEQVEFQVRDRLSFTRFLRLGIEDSIPDATTLWLFREKLADSPATSSRGSRPCGVKAESTPGNITVLCYSTSEHRFSRVRLFDHEA